MQKTLFTLFLLFILGLCSVPDLFAETEAELGYKVWENKVLFPSFGAYLDILGATRDKMLVETGPLEADELKNIIAVQNGIKLEEKSSSPLFLNLREAMEIALSANREMQSARLQPGMAELDTKIAKTVYDPTFFSDNKYYDTDRPIQSVLDNGTNGSTGKNSFLERGWSTQTGVRQPLPTGGSAIISYEADNLDNNSDLTIPNPQYTSRFRLELRQSLLKEFGDKSHKSKIALTDIASQQAESEYKKSLSDVLEELALYYWRYTYYYQLEQISQAAVQSGEKILLKIRTKNEQGIANLLDLDRAESTLFERKVRLITDQKLSQTTLNQLKLVLGISPASMEFFSNIKPTEPFLDQVSIPEWGAVLQMALARRQEIAIAKRQIDAATIKTQLAEHLKLPTVDARTGINFNGLGEAYTEGLDDSLTEGQASWDVGVVIEWPIGGRKSSFESQKSQLAKRRAQIQFKQAIEKVAYEVNSTYKEVQLSAAEVAVSRQAKDAYQKVLEREKALFSISRATNQRIMDAQDEFYDANRNHLKALLNLNLAILKLQWAQGILLETFEIVL